MFNAQTGSGRFASGANGHVRARASTRIRLFGLIWLGIILSCAGLIGFAGWATWKAYHRANETAAMYTQNLVRVLKQHTERTIESVDMLLKVVARELGPDSADPVKRSWATEGLAYLTQDVPHIFSLRLLDGKNPEPLFEFVRSQRVGDAADRDALQAHANARYLGLHVGKPLRDAASGAWVVGISRRITGREGTPGHVVIAHVSLDYFHEFYERVAVGDQGTVTLFRSDGTVLARRPSDAAIIGRNIARSQLFRHELPRAKLGTFATVALNDGIARLYSYQELEELPLVVTVGLGESEILAAWMNDAKRDGGLAVGASLLFILIGALLSREVRRRDWAEIALSRSEERLRLALDAGRMLAWELDPATGFVTRSENSTEIIGAASGEIEDFFARVLPQDSAKVRAAVQHASSGEMTPVEFRYLLPSGETRWLEVRAVDVTGEGGVKRVVGTTFDITTRKAIEEQVWQAANHDGLTGLVNRSYFHIRLEAALRGASARPQGRVGLLLIDLDDFKRVNDTLGHDAGDALLHQAADRLRSLGRDCDTVARLGGDEFAVIVADASPADTAALAERVVGELGRPYTFKDRLPTTRASIGIACYPDHHDDPAELMKDADMALYAAKAHGRNRVVVYSPQMRTEIEQRVQVTTAVREALHRGRIVPFYQAKISLSTGRIVGFEALARWRHPSRGVLAPGAFASVFDDHELAAEIGKSMVQQVASDICAWRGLGLRCGRIAVNLSAVEFNNPLLADEILQLLSENGVAPDQFEIEVTESVLLGRTSEQVSAILERFHHHGVTIALDDFGTGYASLSHLKQFPVDLIKIDRSFIRDLERDPEDAAIINAVIGLGKSLGIEVIAEGVETAGQADHLREHGCDQAQGYFFARPLAGSRVPWLLRQGYLTGPSLVGEVRQREGSG